MTRSTGCRAHLKAGRFGKWLENARDWAISRSRYWGNPIPIWRCDACKAMECLGSRAELEKKTGTKTKDLHKHFIDSLTYACSCGGTMRRIPEVLDCWFESGAMPYGQNHYPFENRAHFDANFPADFISESIDQTRGWFYTLVVLGAALFDKPTFRNVIVSGLILDSEGKKMSKSARNYADPMEVIAAYGADAMRLFLLDSAVLKAEDLRFSEAGVKDVVKNVIIPLWNSYSFFVTYANIDGFSADGAARAAGQPAGPLDPLRGGEGGPGGHGAAGGLRSAEGRGRVHGLHRPAEQLVHPPLAPPLLAFGKRRGQAGGLPDAARAP